MRRRPRRRRDPEGALCAYVRFADGNTRLVLITSPPAPESFEFFQFPGDPLPLLPYEIERRTDPPSSTLAIVRPVTLRSVEGKCAWYEEGTLAIISAEEGTR